MINNWILIIDDDYRNIFALKMVLKAKGFSAHHALSYKEGLIILQEQSAIKLVLMDMMMPEVDGYQAIKLLRNMGDFKNLPIIAITAQAMVGDKERCIAAGADGYVAKPVNLDHLMIYIDKYLVKNESRLN
jgi:two-component system, cell cycle response regulator DivK